jgi:FSR family fosmidomycin resistance protein-like MFS transporter
LSDNVAAQGVRAVSATVFPVLIAISFSHMLNDTIQSLLPAIYPLLKSSFELSYTQIGLITFTFQLTASLLQPFVGIVTDRHPMPYSLAAGMGFSLIGLLLLSRAPNYHLLLFAAALVGLGSSVFHPESSRVARMASGGRHGLAQSIFQVGGNAGSALGPLLAAFIVLPHGRSSIAWFSIIALLAIVILWNVGAWYKRQTVQRRTANAPHSERELPYRKVVVAVTVLVILTFSKFLYMASLSSYYTFFLIHKFGVSIQSSQIYLFLYLAATAVGTLFGGPIGDRFGRRVVIWFSILGVLPFTLLLPYANLFWTGALTVVIGLILASAFSTIVVFAQELVPGKIGMISGIFFGIAFGMGGIGAAALGRLADATSIEFVFRVCAYLPAIGLLTVFLPNSRGLLVAPAR